MGAVSSICCSSEFVLLCWEKRCVNCSRIVFVSGTWDVKFLRCSCFGWKTCSNEKGQRMWKKGTKVLELLRLNRWGFPSSSEHVCASLPRKKAELFSVRFAMSWQLRNPSVKVAILAPHVRHKWPSCAVLDFTEKINIYLCAPKPFATAHERQKYSLSPQHFLRRIMSETFCKLQVEPRSEYAELKWRRGSFCCDEQYIFRPLILIYDSHWPLPWPRKVSLNVSFSRAVRAPGKPTRQLHQFAISWWSAAAIIHS